MTVVEGLQQAHAALAERLMRASNGQAWSEYERAQRLVVNAIDAVNRGVSLDLGLRLPGQFDDVELGDRTSWVPRP